MELDLTTVLDEAASKVWDDINIGREAAPFDEQNDMVKYALKAQVLPVMRTVTPVVERAIKDRLIKIINECDDLAFSADETLLALTVELSEDEEDNEQDN